MKTHKGLSSRKYEDRSEYQNIPPANFYFCKFFHHLKHKLKLENEMVEVFAKSEKNVLKYFQPPQH